MQNKTIQCKPIPIRQNVIQSHTITTQNNTTTYIVRYKDTGNQTQENPTHYNTIQDNTVQKDTIRHNAIRDHTLTIQFKYTYSTTQTNTHAIQYKQNTTIQLQTMQHNTAQHNTTQYHTTQDKTTQYTAIQHCTKHHMYNTTQCNNKSIQ